MIILKRDDGMSLNLTAAISFYDHPTGLVVEMPNGEYYMTSITSTAGLQETVQGRFATMVTIRGHFEAWPNTLEK